MAELNLNVLIKQRENEENYFLQTKMLKTSHMQNTLLEIWGSRKKQTENA